MATSPDVASSPPTADQVRDQLMALPPGFLIRRAQQVHAALWAHIVSQDVTIPQFAVLRALHEEPWIDQTTLGERAALDRSNTADVVRRLAAKQLLYRHRDLEDGRRHLLGLTPKGEAVYASLAERAHEVNQRLLAGLPLEARKRLVELLVVVVGQGEWQVQTP